jgi:large subunit ribosomal protein L31
MPKKGLHPVYNPTVISCACGNKIETYSTRTTFNVDICAACHPFYTGKQKFIDTAGRIEKFNKKYNKGGSTPPTPAG